MNSAPDPYGEEYGWEDPWEHVFLTMCTGCPMCVDWEGKPYDQIRAERIARVEARRLHEHRDEETPSEAGRRDRRYWNT